ncbi:MAG: ParB N-terminal domain-containing protein [Caenispirillum sp.]|nr:ParB N-terminal domain-containing protein [Caenispirillum sp.]
MQNLGLQSIPVDQIDASFRLRQVDDGYAAALAENIEQVGRLRQPIEVRKDKKGYRLIAGGHRLAAVRLLEWPFVDAFVYDATEDEARLAEIDENLVRHELNPLDHAVFLAERKAIWERLYPETRKGAQGGRGGQRNESDTMSFSKNAAERLGISERTIERAVSIATKLSADVRAQIIGTPLALVQKELMDLAKLPPAEQRAVLPLLLGDEPKAKSVRQAHAQLTGRTQAATAPDGFQKLLTAWRHASADERSQFVAWLEAEGEWAPPAKATGKPKLEAVG